MLGITGVYHGAWRRRWDFEASPQCGLFSQLGYILVRLSAPVSPSAHGPGSGYLARSLPGCTGCVQLRVKAGPSVSFNW